MGLDFAIYRKKKGEAYESSAWEEVVYGRNCHATRDVVLRNIGTYDRDNCEAKLTIGTMNDLVVKLAEELGTYNLNDDPDLLYDDGYTKMVNFTGQLCNALYEDINGREYGDVEYEYKLIDSY